MKHEDARDIFLLSRCDMWKDVGVTTLLKHGSNGAPTVRKKIVSQFFSAEVWYDTM